MKHLHTQVAKLANEEDKRALALSLNLDRRHLSPEERARMIEVRKEYHIKRRQEGASIRQIAEETGSHIKQVQRDTSAVDMSTAEKVVGRDGKTYPATMPQREPVPAQDEPEEEEEDDKEEEDDTLTEAEEGDLAILERAWHRCAHDARRAFVSRWRVQIESYFQ